LGIDLSLAFFGSVMVSFPGMLHPHGRCIK
jgi:hypothetical protein